MVTLALTASVLQTLTTAFNSLAKLCLDLSKNINHGKFQSHVPQR